MGPLILIGITQLCLGGILKVDFQMFLLLPCDYRSVCKLEMYHFFVYSNFCPCPKHKIMKTFFCILMPKMSTVSGSWLQIMKLHVNLNSAIYKCSAVDPNAVMGEPSEVLSLAVVGCVGIL